MKTFAAFIVLAFLLPFRGIADKFAGRLLQLQQKYPDEKYVVLRNERTIEVRRQEGRPRILMSNEKEAVCLHQASFLNKRESVFSSKLVRLDKVEAFTIVPGNGGYKKLQVRNFSRSTYRDPGVFHDDTEEISFEFLGMGKGTRSTYSTVHQIMDPHLIPAFYFNSTSCVESSEFTITVDKGINIGYKLLHDEGLNIEFSKEEKKASTVYRWKLKDPPKIRLEDDSPGFLYYAAQLFVYIKDYEVAGVIHKVCGDAADLNAWYYDIISKVRKQPGKEIQFLADSLTRNLKEEEDKVRAIYQWVQKQVRYIAFEEGMEGFLPRVADTVLKRRYGDCKDMSMLLERMLFAAGITAYPCWIGTRELPYDYSTLPLPVVDNHMIVAYPVGKSYAFLDATSESLPYPVPAIGIQGKEALVSKDSLDFEIVRVAVPRPEENLTVDSVFLHTDGLSVSGTGRAELHGYTAYLFLSGAEEKNHQQMCSFIGSYLPKGNNKYKVTDFEMISQDLSKGPVRFTYEFTLENYATRIGQDLYLNLNLVAFNPDKVMDPDRVTGYEIKFRRKILFHVSLDIPRGYSISALPQDYEYHSEDAGFSVSYSQNGSSVTTSQVYYENFILLRPLGFRSWNELVMGMRKNASSGISLKK